VGQQRVRHLFAPATQRLQGTPEINGVPEHDGGGDQREAAGAVLLRLRAAIVQAPQPVEADRTGQRVAGLAFVQLRGRAPTQLRVLEPVEREQRALDAPELMQGPRKAVLAWVGTKTPQHQGRADDAGAHRGGEPQQVVPVRRDQALVDPAGHEGRQRRPGIRASEAIEPALGEVGDAWREPEAEQMRQAEDVLGDATPIRVVGHGRDRGLVVEQPVHDVRRLAVGRDHLGVERSTSASRSVMRKLGSRP
jgi:hypothetical protein